MSLFWGRSEVILGQYRELGGHLGPVFGVQRPFRGIRKPFLACFWRSRGHFGSVLGNWKPFWACFGEFGGHFGPVFVWGWVQRPLLGIWRPFGPVLGGHLWGYRGPSGLFWGPCHGLHGPFLGLFLGVWRPFWVVMGAWRQIVSW